MKYVISSKNKKSPGYGSFFRGAQDPGIAPEHILSIDKEEWRLLRIHINKKAEAFKTSALVPKIPAIRRDTSYRMIKKIEVCY